MAQLTSDANSAPTIRDNHLRKVLTRRQNLFTRIR